MAQLDDAKSITARMYDLLASSYNHIVPFFTDFGEQLVAEARVEDGERVLDVATGQGACLIPAAAAVGPTGAVVGIDISEGMIEVLDRSINGGGTQSGRRRTHGRRSVDFRRLLLRCRDVRICALPS